MTDANDIALVPDEELALDLLRQVGVRGEPELSTLAGGRNNRAYRMDVGDERFVAKIYCDDRAGTRERPMREWAFTQFVWQRGILSIPEPIAITNDRRACLFRFVGGRPCTAVDITRDAIDQAAAFVREVNRHRMHDAAAALPLAAEACFSIDEHLSCVDRRVDALRRELSMSAMSKTQRDAAVFVNGELGPQWRVVRARTVVNARREGLDCDEILSRANRVLSPSDLGLHNALADERGRLTFLDFEYAGWDDPAKLVCDFFCQPALPIPITLMETFIAAAFEDCNGEQRRRIALLLPVYRVKWTCMLLNEFRSDGRDRRGFAARKEVNEARLEAQLRKAEGMLVGANDSIASLNVQRHCA